MTRHLLALALAAFAIRVLRATAKAPRTDGSAVSSEDEEDIVGMPTTYHVWVPDHGYSSGFVIRHGAMGPYVETAPTSRN